MTIERALGLSFLHAAQTWRQLVVGYGEDEPRGRSFGLTSIIVVLDGGTDVVFSTHGSKHGDGAG